MDKVELQKLVTEVSQKELREDESTRSQVIQQFREWVETNPDLLNCRTDDSFLLRFLRVKKFSVPLAEQTLVKFLRFRRDFSQFAKNLDILDPDINDIVTSGYMFASPHRDDKGRQVIIAILSRNDPTKVKYKNLGRVDNLTYSTLMENEATQVLGYTHIFDAGNITFAHATIWPAIEFAQSLSSMQQSFPMRHKEIHVVNMPPVVKFFFDIAKASTSEKMRQRFMVHDSLEDLVKHVNPKVLPKEYGGTIPVTEMIDMWKQELLSKRDTILGLDKMELHETGHEDSLEVGSFRKLNVD